MSTGANCEYVELEPDIWYYILERWDAPRQAWDWREFADVVGPFPSDQAARSYLHAHNANPGGSVTYRYDSDRSLSAQLRELIEREAVDPSAYPHGQRLGYDYDSAGSGGLDL